MIPHGRASKYSNDGCRCDDCRKAWAAYVKDLKYRRKFHGRAGGFVVPHGTTNGYFNYGCRCGLCAEARREYARSRRASEDAA